MYEQPQSRSGAGGTPLEHLQVAVRVAKCGDGLSSDVLVDGHGFADVVVDKIQLWEPGQAGNAADHLKLGDDAAADDLLGRNAVDLLCPDAHKLNSPSGDDKCFEAIGAQIGEEFHHRLENHLRVGTIEFWMFGSGDP